ncbi:hypothetical protein KY285_010723 [Solanum tuberosum]|nr:hypothetical protein KY289_011305 [Solanum tuberosum]KAH0735016.1 hypothetical protein KY285_010723 [Solanum tuberosum]
MREQAGVGGKGNNIRAKQARQAEKRSKYFSTRREFQQKCDLLQRKLTWMFHWHRVSKVTIIGAINRVFPSVTEEIPYSKEIFLARKIVLEGSLPTRTLVKCPPPQPT